MFYVGAFLDRFVDGGEDAIDEFVHFENVVEMESSNVGSGWVAHFEIDTERRGK